MDLKTWLELNEMSAADFSRMARISKSTLSRILRGKTPSLETANTIERITEGEVTWRE